MNLVFDKKTLRVLSLFDNIVYVNDQDVLKSMFPQSDDASLWNLTKNIHHKILDLKVQLDNDGDPEFLLCKGKIVYQRPEEKQNIIERRIDDNNTLKQKGIILGKDLSDFLIKSPYTKKEAQKKIFDWMPADMSPMFVIWRGFFKIATGYSAIGRNVLFRLHNYGIFAKPEHLPSHSDIDPKYLSYLSKYDRIKVARRCKDQIKILSHTPLSDNFTGRKIIFTMMETETLHPDFVNMCNRYDEVWVPCRHNYNLFTREGVKVPVHVVRLGVDEKNYFEKDSVNIDVSSGLLPLLGNGLKKFKFVSLFQWGLRKCPDILVKSFVKAFSDKDDVCLIIVNHYGDPSAIFNEVQNYAKSVRKTGFPSILLYNRIPMDREMPSLYRFCDAFISTSRGEGFSLPHVEAGACGIPVISAHHTAMKDYLSSDNSYLVDVQKKEVCPPELAASCGWYSGQLFNVIGQDEMCKFAERMQFVVNNYEEALGKAKKFQDMVQNNYTWDITTSLVARRIREG